MNDLRRAALTGTFWSAFQQIGDRGVRVVIYLILARLVAPEDFGLVALAAVFIEFGQIFLNQGLTAAIVQRDDLQSSHLDSAFVGNLVFGALLGLAAVAGADLAARLTREPGITDVIRWLAVSFPLSALSSVQEAVLRREMKFRALALRSVVSQLVGGVVALTMAIMGFGVWSLVALELVRRAIGAVMLWRVSDWRPGWEISARSYLDLFQFGVHIMGIALLTFFRNRSDYYLIGAFLGTAALGYYSIARQLVNAATQLINGSVGEVMWATFSRLQSEPDRLARAVTRSTELLATVAWPLFIGGAVVANELVTVSLGARWAPSAPIVQAFLLCSALSVISTSLMTAITAIGEIRLRVVLETVIASISLIAMIAALPGGIDLVAWAYAGSLALLLPLQVSVAFKKIPIVRSDYFRGLLAPAAACAAMLGVVLAIRLLAENLPRTEYALAAMIVGGMLAYLTAMHIFGPDQVRRTRADLALLVRSRREN